MATYTGVADANGDFTVSFSSSYASGEKITVTAEKDGAEKTIELFAPSEITGGGVIQFRGNLNNFPNNIGGVVISGVAGKIQNYAFAAHSNSGSIWRQATSLQIEEGVTEIGSNAFDSWAKITSLTLPNSLLEIQSNAFVSGQFLAQINFGNSLQEIGADAFSSCSRLLEINLPNSVQTIASSAFFFCTAVTKVSIGQNMLSMGGNAFYGLSNCLEVKCTALSPPSITSSTFTSLNTACVFKVPATSVAAYQAAANWSAFADRIQAI